MTAVSIALLAYTGLQGRFSDLYLSVRGGAPLSDHVAVVPIDDEALYLWDPAEPSPEVTPRALLATLVATLDEAGARVVVLDTLLTEPAPGDDALQAAAAAHGAVLAAERVVRGDPSVAAFSAGPSPGLAAIHGAPANLQAEEGRLFSDALLVRRVPLVHRSSHARLGGAWPLGMVGGEQDEHRIAPALPLAAAWLFRARERDPSATVATLEAELARACAVRDSGRLRCDASTKNLGLPPTPRPLHAPLDLNLRGREGREGAAGQGLATVPAARLLRLSAQQAIAAELGAHLPLDLPADVRAALADRVVLVGRVDAGGAGRDDRFVTAYGWPLLRRADMSGLRIQAQAVDLLLSGHHLRLVGRPWTWLLGIALAAGVSLSWRRLSDARHAALWLGVCALVAAGGVLIFSWTDGLALELDLPLALALVALLLVHLRGWASLDAP
ncbi:MAG: CHASE2 domain-containing protein [Alphaproteobacteria bacterium]|nr:CHASE2 domain-containing protein [Alphaproteobacteria bacterium]